MDEELPNLPGFLMTLVPEAEFKDGLDLHESVLSFARESFRARRALQQTFFVFITSPRRALLVLTPQDPDYEGTAPPPWVIGAVREFARAGKATALWCASEAWVARNLGGNPYQSRPSDRADRREAVMVTYECPLAQPPMQLWLAMIDRSARPKLLHWEPHHDAFSLDRLQYLLPREAYGPAADA